MIPKQSSSSIVEAMADKKDIEEDNNLPAQDQDIKFEQNEPLDEGKVRTRNAKERTIEDIVEKVTLWRSLYNGTTDVNGNYKKYSLEIAAKKVGVHKKSLDDYLL